MDEVEVKSMSDYGGKIIAETDSKDPFEAKLTTKSLNGISPTVKKRITRAVGSKAKEDGTITGYSLFQVKQPPYNLDYLAKLYEINPYNFSSINAKVVTVVGQGYDFVASALLQEKMESINSAKSLDNARKKFIKLKRKVNEWLDSLNNEYEFSETLRMAYLDYEVTGNGYIEVGRDINGEIGYVGHIPSTTMRVRAKRDGFVQIVGKDTTFFRNFGDTTTKDPIGGDKNPNEIIHIKNYSPTSTFYGIPSVVAAKNAIAGAEFAARYNLDYFENKAVPRYIITIKGAHLGESSERKLLEFLEGIKGMAGNHRSILIPIPEDTSDSKSELKLHEVENGIQDSSFNNYRKSTRDEVLAANGVPITKVSVAEGVSLAIARDADKTFSEQVIKPMQALLAKKINRIVGEQTDALEIKFNEISLTDADTQSKIWERLIRVQALVPNEVRAQMGMGSIDGGDQIVDFTSGKGAETAAQTSGNRNRDQQRQGNAPDTQGEARNPQGEGRTQG
jgi:PBSX family phage portal protein